MGNWSYWLVNGDNVDISISGYLLFVLVDERLVVYCYWCVDFVVNLFVLMFV